jgi:integrase
MGRRHSGELPAMRHDRRTGHARVRINGKTIWLGRWGSEEARFKYDSLVAAYIASGRKSPEAALPPPAAVLPATPPASDLTIGELSLAWLKHIRATKGDCYKQSSTYGAALSATRALRGVATLPARQFGPRQLLEVREAFASTRTVRRNKKGEIVVDKPRTRRYVNDTMQRVVAMFSWAVVRELVPGDKPAALREVKPLRAGDIATVVDTPPREAVDDERVEAVLVHLRPPLRALVRFIRLTGCRPSEAARLRLADVYDRDRAVWRYAPPRHKNAWRGHGKHIPIGPEAQAVVLDALGGRGDDAIVFDPRLAVPDRKPVADTIKMQPRRPSSRVRETYGAASIRSAIRRACEKAGCQEWFPYLLRYARNQEIRRLHGPEAAAANLGDRSPQMLNRYAPPGWEAAVEAALKTG